jgi:hypothetical protein
MSGLGWKVGYCVVLAGFCAVLLLFSGTTNDGVSRRLLNKSSIAEILTTDLQDPTLLMSIQAVKQKGLRKEGLKAANVSTVTTTFKGNNSNSKVTHAVSDGISIQSIQAHGTDENRKLFYMYDLDEEFWWRWPVDGSDCSGNGYVGHEHKEHSGIGPLILPDDGLYLTWHFSLFSSLYNRMKRSSRRTFDPEKASLFIIPYDLGLDGYLDATTCRNRMQCSHGLMGKLTAILSQSKYFQRHQGADHALLWSLGQYHPWPRAGCDIFMKTFCGKCTITCYWMDATKPDSRFVSVPFPSGYHWWDGIKNLPWDRALAPQRNLTAVYIGSTQTLNPTHTKIRRAMTAQCNTSSECHWFKIGHSSKDTSIADFLSLYKKAKFCLCPPGDDPARKAVFDSIVSGCIPVIFELNTLYNQYPWHLTEQQALDISVYIPGGAVRSGKLDFMSVLLAISPEVIRKKQEVLAVVAPRVQYAMPPPELLRDRRDNTTWDPPFKDGVELTLDGMFTRADAVVNNRSTHIPPKLQSGREWGREYDMVRVQVPNITTDRVALQQEQDKMIREGSKVGQSAVAHSSVRPGHGVGHGQGHSPGGHGQGHSQGHGQGQGGHRRHKVGGAGGEDNAAGEGSGPAHGRPHGGKHGGAGGGAGLRGVPSMGAPGERDGDGGNTGAGPSPDPAAV